MTDDEIRIAVAESLGWTSIWTCPLAGVMGKDPEFIRRDSFRPIPNYTKSLDAMHEVEKAIPKGLRQSYFYYIADTFKSPPDDCADWITGTATARQRAEAYLRTIGKWK